MQILYPPIKTYAQHQLPVNAQHTLYLEESGNPIGKPVLVIHGGPGIGSDERERRFFDPEKYRIILWDQRGSGLSTPTAELNDNNTQALLSDINAIRHYLNIDRWVLFGSTWGCVLSLLYAQQYPEHVAGLILHGLFLGRKQDIAWFYKEGANMFFPDYWDEFMQFIPPEERNDLIAAYHRRLTGTDELAKMAAAKHWALWQARCYSLQPNSQITEQFSGARFASNLACIESHYLMHHYFIEDNVILKNMASIQHIPGIIIHGRYDVICPLHFAWELHKAWDNSELYIVRDAGHALWESAIVDAIILSTQKMCQMPLRVS